MTPHPRPRPPRSSPLRGDRGSATAETAIVLPVIVALMVVVAVAGAGLAMQVRLEGAARAAARELARGESEADARAAAQRVGGEGTQVAITADGPWVRVAASRTLRAPRGLLAGSAWTLRADAEARREPHLVEQAAARPAPAEPARAAPAGGRGP